MFIILFHQATICYNHLRIGAIKSSFCHDGPFISNQLGRSVPKKKKKRKLIIRMAQNKEKEEGRNYFSAWHGIKKKKKKKYSVLTIPFRLAQNKELLVPIVC